jgi:uncharacterized protein (TIGR00730 family)
MKFVCVFCGSSDGARDAYGLEALRLGRLLGKRRFGLVYGGASVGLMGTVADAAMAAGAPVVGVLPAVLKDREVAHAGLTELLYVDTMHARKALMAERADAFVALPGGYGTLDEFMEILTWAQLGIHRKPCVLVNTLGFYDGLLTFLDHAVQEGFLRAPNRGLVRVAGSADGAMEMIARLLAAESNATPAK